MNNNLGLPLAALGSLCFGARKSARPCGAYSAWVWPSATPAQRSAVLAFGQGRLCRPKLPLNHPL